MARWATLGGPHAARLRAALYHARKNRLARIAAADGGGGAASVAWVADGSGGVVTDLGGGSYRIDSGTNYQGCICGPLTGDFVCTIDPEVGTEYSLEIGVSAKGAGFTNPSSDPYDGRAGAAFWWFNPSGAAEWVVTDSATGTTSVQNTSVAPNDHTYTIERVGDAVSLKKDGVEVGSRTLSGDCYLYSSQTTGTADSAATVSTTA